MKDDLISRSELITQLEGFKLSLGDPILGLVVARVIDRVRVQPAVAGVQPAVAGVQPAVVRSSQKRYSVYDKKTDQPVIINGTPQECANAMGMNVGSFYSTYSRLKTGARTSNLWEIYLDEEDDDDEDL